MTTADIFGIDQQVKRNIGGEELMINKNIGGIERSHIIKFLFRVLATQHYNLIINALNDEDIIIACLRIAWNDAFRHVSKNQPNAKKKQDFKAMHNKDVNEYIVNCILRNEIVLNSFLNYCRANTPAKKVLSLENDINNGLLRCFEDVKVIDKKEDSRSSTRELKLGESSLFTTTIFVSSIAYLINLVKIMYLKPTNSEFIAMIADNLRLKYKLY